MGSGSMNSLDGLANGETADIASSSPSLQRMLQSNSDVLSSSASTTFSSTTSSITASSASISSPNSPSLTTLTPAKSPAMNYTSPPSMPVSTSGTPTPATPLTSTEHHLSSGLANSAPSSNSVTLSTMNSGMQPSNMANSYSQGQYNMLDMNNFSTSMMASLNGPSVGNGMNSMNVVQRNGPSSYGRSNSIGTNMNVSSSAANAYDSMSHIQSEPLSIKMEPNFMTGAGLNGSLDSARSLQGSQVSCESFYCLKFTAINNFAIQTKLLSFRRFFLAVVAKCWSKAT